MWASFLEAGGEGFEVGGGDGDLAVGVGGVERDGIAAAGLAHAGGDEGAGAHLAGDALRAHVEADRAADGAGVGDGDDVAVGLFEEEEADFGGAALPSSTWTPKRWSWSSLMSAVGTVTWLPTRVTGWWRESAVELLA